VRIDVTHLRGLQQRDNARRIGKEIISVRRWLRRFDLLFAELGRDVSIIRFNECSHIAAHYACK
jgi:hypothetical protein